MNHTKYGNIAAGEDGSIARHKANEEYLFNELQAAVRALDGLRDHYVPNDETRPEVTLADAVLARHKSLL